MQKNHRDPVGAFRASWRGGGSGGSAGPIKAAIERAGREIVATQREEGRSRGRFWTGIALIAGGGVLSALSAVELGDDEAGPDDGEDVNGSDDGEDSDGWGNKAMLGGGIAGRHRRRHPVDYRRQEVRPGRRGEAWRLRGPPDNSLLGLGA